MKAILEDRLRSGRRSVPINEALIQGIQQKLDTITLIPESQLGTFQPTIVRHIHQLRFANKKPRFFAMNFLSNNHNNYWITLKITSSGDES